jgi:cellulose synthase/poly-beta-1,6-N-acetylglucosamine synthase-like glycosyltransferase
MAVIVLMAFAHLLKWLLILITLPLLVELLSLTLGAILPASGFDDEDGQEAVTLVPVKRLMIVVPSHNEELSIARCVQSLETASGSAKNVIVVAHNCSDATAAIAQKAGAHVEIVNDLSLAGKGYALKHGFDFAFNECGADAVMIVDADSTVSANIISEVSKRLPASAVVQCRYQVRNHAASWRAGLTALAFLGINVVRPRGRDRLGLSCGIFGNGFAMRKDVLDSVPYDAHSIVEDMEFHLALVNHGYKVRFIQDALVLGDMPLSASTSASQHNRWEGGRLRLLSDWGLPLLRKIFQGKFSLTEPLIDLLGLPLALEVFSLLILLLYPSQHTRDYVIVAFGIILAHLGVVIHASPDRKESLRNLLLSPVYLFWRVTMVTSVVRASSKGAAWVRTTRDASVEVAAHDILAPKTANSSQESS